MPHIVSLTPKPAGPRPPDRYLRVSVAAGELVAGHGLAGDGKALPSRQLNVMSAETLAQLAAEGFHTGPGEMGEQLVLAGVDVAALAAGARLRLGERACIEIVKRRTGCSLLVGVQGQPLSACAGRLGVIASVVEGGPVRVGDEVRLIENVSV